MLTVDFIYESRCPNVKAARANLVRALTRAGLPARWCEHEIGDASAPARVRGYGSPTILIDGHDVAGGRPSSADCCRLYDGVGVPSVEMIVAAIARSTTADDPEL